MSKTKEMPKSLIDLQDKAKVELLENILDIHCQVTESDYHTSFKVDNGYIPEMTFGLDFEAIGKDAVKYFFGFFGSLKTNLVYDFFKPVWKYVIKNSPSDMKCDVEMKKVIISYGHLLVEPDEKTGQKALINHKVNMNLKYILRWL